MKLTAGLLALGLVLAPAVASARGHGHHSYGRHSYGRHSYGHSYRGYATTFRTSYCKSAACLRKHPDGKYVHPITPRRHR